MSEQPIRVLVVEDHLIARVGICTIISTQPDMRVVGEASDGEAAVAAHARHQPDVTLMDLRLPLVGGIEAIAAIRARTPDARIIALSTYSGDEDIKRALEAGAKAYLTKDVLDTELIGAIRLVHAGGSWLPPAVQAVLASRPPGPDLTDRERQVLGFIVRGFGNKQIAYELHIAEYTVKNHVKRILDKLGVEDRTEAATAALRRGIVH